MVQFDYHAAYYVIEDGWYLAKVLDFPGVLTQGSTLEKARKMLRSALREMVEWLLQDGQPIPRPEAISADPKADVSEPIKLVLQLKTETPQEETKTPEKTTPREASSFQRSLDI